MFWLQDSCCEPIWMTVQIVISPLWEFWLLWLGHCIGWIRLAFIFSFQLLMTNQRFPKCTSFLLTRQINYWICSFYFLEALTIIVFLKYLLSLILRKITWKIRNQKLHQSCNNSDNSNKCLTYIFILEEL